MSDEPQSVEALLEKISALTSRALDALDTRELLGDQVRRHLRVKAGMVMSDQVFADEAEWLRTQGRVWLADLIDPGQRS